MLRPWKAFQSYLLAAPQTLILILFLVLSIALIIVVSVWNFWNFHGFAMTSEFSLSNYLGIVSSNVYLATYLNTFKFAAVVWLLCLLISYPVTYLSFHIKSPQWQTIWFNVTSPALYALGTLTTIVLAGAAISAIQFLSGLQTQAKVESVQ